MIHRVVGTATPSAHVPRPTPPESLELSACYRYCEAVARAHHHNFPVASFFVPAPLRRHIWAVYAFARAADDFADEPEYEGRRAAELDRWEERLHACYFGDPADHPVFVALADTVHRFDLPITEFQQLLRGFRTDLETTRYATFTDLRSYASLAAEPAGHLLLYLGGYRDPVLHRYADDLSLGLALAKLLQDIAADLRRGRIYIPSEDLRYFGVADKDLHSQEPSAALGALVRFEVARTRAHFERARPLVERIAANLGIEMALIWEGGMQILNKIAAAGPRLLQRRPRLTSVDKALVLTRALRWRRGDAWPRIRQGST